jgi:uncharacterized protein YegL
MFVKKLLIILSVLTIVAFPMSVCSADADATLSQAYAWEQTIDVFVTGNMNSDTLSCKVSNQTAEIIGSGILADKGVTIRTTILVDISASMPSKVRENVKTCIATLVKNIKRDEQYRIVVFGEQLTIFQDFTADDNDLVSAISKIEFNGKQSRIYDAIYNTIPDMQRIDGLPCYYRTIIFTDGVDDTASGITKEELYLRLQNETYPIYVVAVSAVQQTEQNKELAALVRISGGKYTNLAVQTSAEELSSPLSADDIFWFRATIPSALLDGSTRQFNISDGVNSVQFDAKVPVFDVPIEETPTPIGEMQTSTIAPEQFAGPVTTAQTTKPAASTPPLSVGSLLGDYPTVAYLGAGIGLIILIIAVFIVIQGKKRISDISGGTSGGKTELLPNPELRLEGGKPCIRLRNASIADQVWDVNLTKDVFVGRDTNCQVCLADPSVSRTQCKIYMTAVATIENLSKSNITQLNGTPLTAPTKIKTGDKLKFGRITIIVELLYAADSCNVNDISKGTMYINV